MVHEPFVFLLMLLSFVLTVGAVVLSVRVAPERFKVLAFVTGIVGACLWLGIPRGVVASIIAFFITGGFFSTLLDGRRMGKRIARVLDVPPNVFFSAIEQVLPAYTDVLALFERSGEGAVSTTTKLLPEFLRGLDALEARFGSQPLISDARVKAQAFLNRGSE